MLYYNGYMKNIERSRQSLPLALFSAILLLLPSLISAQAPASAYSAEASVEAENDAAAFRQAKAAAVEQLFQSIGKDRFFQNYYIQSRPETIRTEELGTEQQEGGLVRISVRVEIDKTDIALSRQGYHMAALGLLDNAEGLLASAEASLEKAQEAEGNLEFPEAYVAFIHASESAERGMQLLYPLNSTDILSEKGNSAPILKQRLITLSGSAGNGIQRIHSIEQKSRRSELGGEAYDLLKSELSSIESFVTQQQKLQPFYDMDPARLKGLLLQVENSLQMSSETLPARYRELQSGLGNQESFLKKRIEIDLAKLNSRSRQLEAMQKDLKREIRSPRLKRQEAARRRALVIESGAKGLSWLFFHSPSDILSFRISPGFSIWHREGGYVHMPMRWDLQLEYGSSGFWFTTALHRDAVHLIDLPDAEVHSNFYQSVDLGFYRSGFFALGYCWDWSRSYLDSRDSSTQLSPQNAVRISFGSMARDQDLPVSIFRYTYFIPSTGDIESRRMLNGELSLLLRLGSFLQIESSALSRVLDLKEDCVHRMALSAGMGIRLPRPFTWGVEYRQEWQAREESGGWSKLSSVPGMWSFYISYSI